MSLYRADQLFEGVMAEFEAQARRYKAAQRIRRPASPQDRWEALREFYRDALPTIEKHRPHVWAIDPYEVDWRGVFTPIEFALWWNIRAAGVVLYPQFPVGRYFVDFGHPVAKVAVECDGAAYHVNLGRDQQRQREIEALGWTVYRITGRGCHTVGVETNDEHGRPVYEPSESEEFIRRIAMNHGLASRYRDE